MKIEIYTGIIKDTDTIILLKKMGFNLKINSEGKVWQKQINNKKHSEIQRIKRFCQQQFKYYRFIDESMERSTNYRDCFFKQQKGIFGTKIYICAYCGKFLKRRNVQVDHIIPVYKAKTNFFYRNLLSIRGIKNVNDIRNLTASCKKCNCKKSANGGLWIIKGIFGRSPVRVIVKELIYLIIGSVLLYFLYIFLKENIGCQYVYDIYNSLRQILK